MSHDKNDNINENNNNSTSEENKRDLEKNNNNFNSIFSLYNNFLIKENRFYHSSKKPHHKTKEILPKYTNIETKINSDKNKIKDYYLYDPIFKDLIEQNSSIYAFKAGFKKLFFGPKGFVTKKNATLRNFYKSFETKEIDFNEKLYIGSMDLFDSLGNYSTYNQRLKLNQKRIIQINGNFDMANPNLIKMKKSYQDYKKKLEISKRKVKNKIINKSMKPDTDKFKNKRFSQFFNSFNLFLDYKKNSIQDNNIKVSLNKERKDIKRNTEVNFLNRKNLINNLVNISKANNESLNNKINEQPEISNIKSIPNKNIFLKTFQNSSIKNNKSIKNIKTEILKTENNRKKTIENYNSKSINFVKFFKRKKDFQKYMNSYKKTFNKKIFSSNTSNNEIRDSLNNFIINNQKYVNKKNKYFKKKIEEPYNEFKEDSKNKESFNNFAKRVDFSNKAFVSKDKKNDNINTLNMAYSFKFSLGGNIPVKDYIKKMIHKKEKEKELKLLNSVRKHFSNNERIIHNLTISLDDIKKKYNYC